MLTSIQNNVYLKDKTLIKSYDVVQWSRAMKQHVIKKRGVHDNVSFKKDILHEVLLNIKLNNQKSLDLSSHIRETIPPTFHLQKAPPKAELLAKQKSRMK